MISVIMMATPNIATEKMPLRHNIMMKPKNPTNIHLGNNFVQMLTEW